MFMIFLCLSCFFLSLYFPFIKITSKSEFLIFNCIFQNSSVRFHWNSMEWNKTHKETQKPIIMLFWFSGFHFSFSLIIHIIRVLERVNETFSIDDETKPLLDYWTCVDCGQHETAPKKELFIIPIHKFSRWCFTHVWGCKNLHFLKLFHHDEIS